MCDNNSRRSSFNNYVFLAIKKEFKAKNAEKMLTVKSGVCTFFCIYQVVFDKFLHLHRSSCKQTVSCSFNHPEWERKSGIDWAIGKGNEANTKVCCGAQNCLGIRLKRSFPNLSSKIRWLIWLGCWRDMTRDVTATRGSTIPNGGSKRAHPAFMSKFGYSGDKGRKESASWHASETR